MDITAQTEICNADIGIGANLNLYDLINSGDNNGTWVELDNSGTSGGFINLDFNGVKSGRLSV